MGRNKFLEKLGLTAFSKNIKLKMDNLERSNKKYVDDKEKTLTYAEYQALSEEEKNNGTTYYVPDMPVSTSGEIIGNVKYGSLTLSENPFTITLQAESWGNYELIPLNSFIEGNIDLDNGCVKLKKGKTYNIFSKLRISDSADDKDTYVEYVLMDENGTVYERGHCSTGLNIRGDSPICYTITPTKDINIGIYVSYRSESATTIYGDNKSVLIVTEIPSYKGLIDVSDEHIKEVTKPIEDTSKASLEKINNHLKNPYIYESVTFDRGAIASDGYLEVTVPYTIPSGYYLVNFMVAHTGHKGVYTFGQYPSGISGDINLKVFFANNETYDMPIATGLIIHVFLAKA